MSDIDNILESLKDLILVLRNSKKVKNVDFQNKWIDKHDKIKLRVYNLSKEDFEELEERYLLWHKKKFPYENPNPL